MLMRRTKMLIGNCLVNQTIMMFYRKFYGWIRKPYNKIGVEGFDLVDRVIYHMKEKFNITCTEKQIRNRIKILQDELYFE